ncbi:MAG TPA: type 4a pilus biogenesis protein PilO [Sedimentisphaerales bacterium]|nr:type 4a pilus biogenesis protein PilO [Sedimentisphaerales bacterium]
MLREHLTKSKRPARTALLAAIVLIGAVAVYNRIVAPHRNYLMAAQRYESAVKHLDRKNQTTRHDLTVKKSKLEELQEKFRQTHLELFDPVEAGRFFTNIQTKSEEAGCIVSLLTFSTGSPASDEKRSKSNHYITKQQAMLSVLGSYANIVALMDKLQDSPKKVCIDSVGINADDQGTVHLECEMTVTIYVIHRKEEHQHD